MNKKQCRDALDLYKKFLIRMDRVGEFLKVAENIGIDKGEIPDLTKVGIVPTTYIVRSRYSSFMATTFIFTHFMTFKVF